MNLGDGLVHGSVCQGQFYNTSIMEIVVRTIGKHDRSAPPENFQLGDWMEG